MRWIVAALAAAGLMAGNALAADVQLPKQLAWTAYGTTSSGYSQSIGLGNMLKAKYDTDLRIIPGKNDVSRMLPLKANQADICACGIAAYFGQEGVYMFANDRWGPTPIYNLFNNIGRNGAGLIVAGDLGVTRFADLKGKRIAWAKGAPEVNLNTTANLAFAGLTWSDVVRVVVPGWGQAMQAILDGQADAAFGTTLSSIYNQISASPRSLIHLPFPHDDKAAWARALAVAPYWYPVTVTNAIALEKNPTGAKSYDGAAYPYPTFVGMPTLSDATAYGLTKAVMENYDLFKNAGPGMDGYQLQNQNLSWVLPYHPGAIRYYKEAGRWTAENQATTDGLLQRNRVLADAWAAFRKTTVAKDAFETAWLAVRAEHLRAAGLAVPFQSPLPEPD
ncbi:MAG: TAXI family TRAP transporter solute-binding subunit [Alphaproteobacteria bacterium]|nr:TAXI family TRAP transporter solute-binding subunit [Alphaproteobacteria bacterium]MCB9928594.1 TAXI family TRAP transporter solute-binding subunit [Alphaproteobacteria bacterium]